jgi:SAM-dependent methyltransferase
MVKEKISQLLRRTGLLYSSDRIRYYLQLFKNRKINRKFKSDNPSIVLPPDYLIYESFQINYHKYYTESINAAKWLCGYFNRYMKLEKLKILDWGCGPGRIIRHLPRLINHDCEYFGTDYNSKSIEWCSKNLPGIHFNKNSLMPGLPYPDGYFDIIYGLSIFTHLSEQMHYDWYRELYRILKPGGIMFMTTQGDNYKIKLTPAELIKYNKGELVIRGNVKEGHRTFSAFHPAPFMRKLFSNTEILDHIADQPEKGRWLPQDVWILRKKNQTKNQIAPA